MGRARHKNKKARAVIGPLAESSKASQVEYDELARFLLDLFKNRGGKT